MDLAKIRKKSTAAAVVQPPVRQPEASSILDAKAPVASEPVLSDNLSEQLAMENLLPIPLPDDGLLHGSVTVPRKTPFDPIAVLLAGREAAGCDEEIQLTAIELAPSVQNDYEEFLCFRVSDETYGINIMQIKEIIKQRTVTEVPRAPSFVSGVISLRGVIIPIIDMLDRLGLSREQVTGKERVVVVKNGDAYAGLLVDEVVQVVRIPLSSFEPAPAILEGIDRDFVSGIGRAGQQMVILLNVESITDINLS
ncbi:MAG: hypothetical protein A2X80_07690 [Geobacteraceae bacterium GWB2_52_12]|nr:MAG: hypothetical protein A2X80_07690 [Geobacteraceae bacterium GWB2_52_12]